MGRGKRDRKAYKKDMIVGDSKILLPEMLADSVDLVLTDVPYDLDMETKIFFHDQFMRISRQWVIVFSPPENQWV